LVPVTSKLSYMICVTFERIVVGVRAAYDGVKPSRLLFAAAARMASSCHWNVVLWTVSEPIIDWKGYLVGEILLMMSETSSFLPTGW
jgi:hypothetical protein